MPNKISQKSIRVIKAPESFFKIERGGKEEKEVKESFEGYTQKRLKLIEYIVMAGFLILVVGFITMFIGFTTLIWTSHTWSADIYRGFIEKLDENTAQNNTLLEKIRTLKNYETTTSTGTR